MAWQLSKTNNFWLKVFSLVLATLIYFVINPKLITPDPSLADNPLRQNATRSFQLPIVVVASAKTPQALQVDPTEVTVVITGDAAFVNNLDPQDIQVSVRLVNVRNPQGSFRVEINAPREVTIQQVWPAHVYVKTMTHGTNMVEKPEA